MTAASSDSFNVEKDSVIDPFAEDGEVKTTEDLTAGTDDRTLNDDDKKTVGKKPDGKPDPDDDPAGDDDPDAPDNGGDAKGKKTDDTDDDDPDDDDPDDDKPKGKKGAEQRKQQLNNEIRDLLGRKRELTEEIAAAEAKARPLKTVEELMDEGLTEDQAKNEITRQELDRDRLVASRAELNNDIEIQSQRVFMDMPWTDPDNADMYDKDLAKAAADAYASVSGITVDEQTSQITAARVLPYQFYKILQDFRTKGFNDGELAGKKAAQRQAARVKPQGAPSVATDDSKVEDPVLAALLRDAPKVK